MSSVQVITRPLIDPETQADRLALDLDQTEKMLKASQREIAGYQAVVENREATIASLRARNEKLERVAEVAREVDRFAPYSRGWQLLEDALSALAKEAAS